MADLRKVCRDALSVAVDGESPTNCRQMERMRYGRVMRTPVRQVADLSSELTQNQQPFFLLFCFLFLPMPRLVND